MENYKEWNTATSNNMNIFHRDNVGWKPVKKEYILYDSTYIQLRNSQKPSMMIELQ